KVHGSLARAGKVRGQTPKVAKQDKKKKPRGRAHKRMQYNRRFVTAGTPFFSLLLLLISLCFLLISMKCSIFLVLPFAELPLLFNGSVLIWSF
ncbi:hypothetical protein Dimus_027632, partial [Dionaea muscipula]